MLFMKNGIALTSGFVKSWEMDHLTCLLSSRDPATFVSNANETLHCAIEPYQYLSLVFLVGPHPTLFLNKTTGY